MRRTKIIATLGPSTESSECLEALFDAGVDAVRLNFSHGSWEDHNKQIARVRETSTRCGLNIAILGDLQGPKIRINRFRDGYVRLVAGQKFALDSDLDPDAGDAEQVGVAYTQLSTDVTPGDVLLLDDGQIKLTVDEVAGTRINCTVVVGGTLSDKKGINRQGGGMSAAALSEKDIDDLRKAAAANLDWIAVSFVRDADDVNRAREVLTEAGSTARIIAKIERAEAMGNLVAIIDASDGVMVARGDLGVEMGFAGLAGMQKTIIRTARRRHKVCITATQMMESMIHSQLPTRAEVSDVANAVMDGTDAVMLSAETAVGEYPVMAVAAMAEVCIGAETYHQSASPMSRHRMDDRFRAVDEAIAMAVMYTANHLQVQAIIALTESGSTALWMSRIRSDIPIFAFTSHEDTRRRVALYRGVYPVSYENKHDRTGPVFREVCQILIDLGHVEPDELVIFTKGTRQGVSGGTNEMRILPVTGQ
ncbi:MAG: pyruvate kinase [Gammaproteobacteria bacterium]|nr:pyruvate kinase [Gammaproteobacteria bacterium]